MTSARINPDPYDSFFLRNKKGGRSNRSPLKGTVAQVEERSVTRAASASSEVRGACRAATGSSPILSRGPTPMRVRVDRTCSSPGRPPARWLGRLSLIRSERSPSDTHPFARPAVRRRHCDHPRALRRHALATALLRRINRRTHEHYERDPQVVHDRPDLPFASTPAQGAARSRAPGCRSGASLEVSCPLQRSLAALALSGAAGLRTIPLRRFITRRPRRPLFFAAACSGVDAFLAPLRFSAPRGFVAMKLAWRTCRVVGVPAESVARPTGYVACLVSDEARLPGVATARRPVALTAYVFDRASG
jgi:hypothetical protein